MPGPKHTPFGLLKAMGRMVGTQWCSVADQRRAKFRIRLDLSVFMIIGGFFESVFVEILRVRRHDYGSLRYGCRV